MGRPAAAIWAFAALIVYVAEMEDRGGQHGGRVAITHAVDEMVERADTA